MRLRQKLLLSVEFVLQCFEHGFEIARISAVFISAFAVCFEITLVLFIRWLSVGKFAFFALGSVRFGLLRNIAACTFYRKVDSVFGKVHADDFYLYRFAHFERFGRVLDVAVAYIGNMAQSVVMHANNDKSAEI